MLICHARRLAEELYELKKEIPILRLFNAPVWCEDFEERVETTDGD